MANSTNDAAAATAPSAPLGFTSGNKIVDRVGTMHFEGNIIDHRWFSAPEFRLKSGLVNLNALIVLGDLVYWHRPVIVRDENTNVITKVRRKFKYEKLYKDYETWGASLGLSKRQVQDAVAFLHKTGSIKRTVGRIKYDDGARSNTLVFLEIDPEKLAEITYRHALPSELQREAPHVTTGGTSRQNVRRRTPRREAINNREHAERNDTTNSVCSDPELREALIALGVGAAVAEDLIARDAGEVERQLIAFPHRKAADDPAAFIVSAIKKRFSLPPAAKRIHEKHHEDASTRESANGAASSNGITPEEIEELKKRAAAKTETGG
jgi:hypothetical protein